jgi:HEAT repeat protein
MRALPEPKRREWRARGQQRYGTALTEGLLMSSRDGVKFHRWNEAFLRPGIERPGAWHYGQQYIGWHVVQTASAIAGAPQELSLYASESYWHGKGSALRRYTLRLDGFVSATAPWKGGRLLTRPLVFDGRQLEINFATSAAGSLRIEMQNSDGEPIEGFALSDCPEMFGDSVARKVNWDGGADLSTLAGKPVRLLFELKDADLYSFQFQDVPSAQTGLLDAATRQRCLAVLASGMRADQFWPSIHAAEALTLAGQGAQVRALLAPKLKTETDDQQRCGLARELVRAGDQQQTSVMMDILRGDDPHGYVHAAESLYKVGWTGDAEPLKTAFDQTDNVRLRLMAAAALAKHDRGASQAAAFTFLRRHLQDESDPEIFRLSAWVLARIGGKQDRALIRSRLDDVGDNKLTLAFLHHALAALGDSAGHQALLKNLQSSDPAIRTYAAVFAGESGLDAAVPTLIRQLDDENLDARIRAAQALLVLAR